MPRTDLIDRLVELGTAHTREQAAGVLDACLSALGPALEAGDKTLLAAALPWPLREVLGRPHEPSARPFESLVDRVQEGTGLSRGPALEQLEVVCRVLAERLGVDERARLCRHLDDALVPLFELPRPVSAPHREPLPAPPVPEVESRHTLSEGRPGSLHPVSDSHPPEGQSHSVARWDEADDATRTLGGYRDERDRHGDTVGTGRPGSRRAPGERKP